MKFHEMTWPALREVDRENTLILFPVAAVEQHGPHLPTFTDSLVAQGIWYGDSVRPLRAVLRLLGPMLDIHTDVGPSRHVGELTLRLL